MLMVVAALSLVGGLIRTAERDNTKTNYCVSESTKYSKGEEDKKIKESSCKKGSTQVDSTKPGLADRKSK